MPYGPIDGIEGQKKAEETVVAARETVGNEVELALDCWLALNVEYAVRLSGALKPYNLK